MEDSRPKTVQIFLPDGNARSVRIAEITSRTIQAVQIPRQKLGVAQRREEVQKVGVYFLFGDVGDDASKPPDYIGEAENCLQRITGHHQRKDFWTTAVAITSKTRSFTKAHARRLEHDCIRTAQEAQRFRLKNTQTPAKPHIPEAMLAELRDNFGTVQTLLAILGFRFSIRFRPRTVRRASKRPGYSAGAMARRRQVSTPRTASSFLRGRRLA